MKEYYESNRLSQSLLKTIHNPKIMKDWMNDEQYDSDEDKDYFRIGSAVDCLKTTPWRFDIDFCILESKRPGGKMGPFIDALPCDLTEDSNIELFKEAYDKSGYKSKIETIVKRFREVEMFQEYYAEKCQCHNKTYLAKNEYELVLKADADIELNQYAMRYFKPTDPDEKCFKQYPIYFEYQNEKCKALLDLLFVNEKEGYIQPLDLKTSQNVWTFDKSFLRYGYYIQAGFYHLAVQWAQNHGDLIQYSDFEIRPMKFIVVGKFDNSPAKIFSCGWPEIEAGIKGAQRYGKYYDGVEDLMAKYKWHKENDEWLLPMNEILNDGEISLDVFSKTT